MPVYGRRDPPRGRHERPAFRLDLPEARARAADRRRPMRAASSPVVAAQSAPDRARLAGPERESAVAGAICSCSGGNILSGGGRSCWSSWQALPVFGCGRRAFECPRCSGVGKGCCRPAVPSGKGAPQRVRGAGAIAALVPVSAARGITSCSGATAEAAIRRDNQTKCILLVASALVAGRRAESVVAGGTWCRGRGHDGEHEVW